MRWFQLASAIPNAIALGGRRAGVLGTKRLAADRADGRAFLTCCAVNQDRGISVGRGKILGRFASRRPPRATLPQRR